MNINNPHCYYLDSVGGALHRQLALAAKAAGRRSTFTDRLCSVCRRFRMTILCVQASKALATMAIVCVYENRFFD